jgi:hypothetical protein
MRQGFPEQGGSHQSVDDGRRFVRIDRNHGMASNKKPGVGTPDAVATIRIQSLPLNLPDLEIRAECFAHFHLECSASTPEINTGWKALTCVKHDGVALCAHSGVREDPNDVGPEPSDFLNFALIGTKPNRRTVYRNFPGFQLQKLQAVYGSHPLGFHSK